MIQAGAASLDFTLPTGAAITGRFEVKLSEGVRDPLGVHAVAIRRNELTVVLVSFDLLVLEEPEVEQIRAGVARETGIPPKHVFLAATHNHSAPVSWRILPFSPPANGFLENVIEIGVRAVRQAVTNMQEAQVRFGQVEDTVAGFNRRGIRWDGTADMDCGPGKDEDFAVMEGKRDSAVSLVAFCRPGQRKPFALLANYASHPASMFHSPLFSAEYPGEIRKNLRRLWGDELVVTFLQGFVGDADFVNPACPSLNLFGESGTERIGLSLAGSLMRAFAQTPKGYSDVALAVDRVVRKVPYRAISQEEYLRSKTAYVSAVENRGDKGDYSSYKNYSIMRLYELAGSEGGYPMEIQVIRIGGAAIVGTPFETFSTWSGKLKEFSPALFTIPVGLANGYGGYLPIRRSFMGGGYQVDVGFVSRLAPEAGDIMLDTAKELLYRLFS
jgi:neutral ceramidase